MHIPQCSNTAEWPSAKAQILLQQALSIASQSIMERGRWQCSNTWV